MTETTGRFTKNRKSTAVMTPRDQHVRFQRCRLVAVDSGESWVLPDSEITVGSSPDCTVTVQDTTVSRKHFSITREGEQYTIRDLDSTNGTQVGDVPIREGYLVPGTNVRAGNFKLRFELDYEEVELPPSENEHFSGLLGQSVRMREIFTALEKVAPTEATVLVQGDTGTGKGAVARAMHRASNRAEGPFVVFDCSATVPTLVESELFGHERGAFTGAVRQHRGALEEADGGTLFIDELAELGLDLQPKLLRALEEREFNRVGSRKPVGFNCRIIAATQRNLWEEVEAGRFRRDLYFRLAVVTIPLPRLSERSEDIPLLVDHFLGDAGSSLNFEGLDDELKKRLVSYDWPGHIRELRNVVERICVMEGGNVFDPDISAVGMPPIPTGGSGEELSLSIDMAMAFKEAKELVINRFERAYLSRLLENSGNNIAKAARDSGVNRTHLYTLLSKHGLLSRDD